MTTVPAIPFIELNSFLKLNSLASTGGQAKLLIRSGAVSVNGVVETRKLNAGDIVTVQGREFVVRENS